MIATLRPPITRSLQNASLNLYHLHIDPQNNLHLHFAPQAVVPNPRNQIFLQLVSELRPTNFVSIRSFISSFVI